MTPPPPSRHVWRGNSSESQEVFGSALIPLRPHFQPGSEHTGGSAEASLPYTPTRLNPPMTPDTPGEVIWLSGQGKHGHRSSGSLSGRSGQVWTVQHSTSLKCCAFFPPPPTRQISRSHTGSSQSPSAILRDSNSERPAVQSAAQQRKESLDTKGTSISFTTVAPNGSRRFIREYIRCSNPQSPPGRSPEEELRLRPSGLKRTTRAARKAGIGCLRDTHDRRAAGPTVIAGTLVLNAECVRECVCAWLCSVSLFASVFASV